MFLILFLTYISNMQMNIYIHIFATKLTEHEAMIFLANRDLGRSHDPVWAQKTTLADCRRFAVFTSIIVFLRLQYKDLVPAISGLSWLQLFEKAAILCGHFARCNRDLSHKPENIKFSFVPFFKFKDPNSKFLQVSLYSYSETWIIDFGKWRKIVASNLFVTQEN